MLTPERYLDKSWIASPSDEREYETELKHLENYHKALIQSIIDDLEANRNKNAVEYLKSKL